MPGSPTKSPKEVRVRWYLQVDRYGRSVSEICAIFGISRKTYYKWYSRDHGLAAGHYHSRRPHPHTKLTAEIRLAVEQAKKQYNYGPEKMRLYLADRFKVNVSTTAIYKYYKKRKLIRKPQRKQPWYTPMAEPFFATKAGENVQTDLKYVPGKAGRWDYQFRAKDSLTRLQYAIDLPTARSFAASLPATCRQRVPRIALSPSARLPGTARWKEPTVRSMTSII
jgi:transposase